MLVGLDLGTKCGWCLHDGNNPVASGIWNLSPGRFEGGGMRLVRFRQNLVELVGRLDAEATIIYYEEVRRHMGTDATHVYGALQGMLQVFCEDREPQIPYAGIPVATIKKCATGKGNANKDAMVAAVASRWPEVDIQGHDQADAIFIAQAAAEGLA